jgi:CDP-glycerol glycerophosphotransferase (TagB/SpsB family)
VKPVNPLAIAGVSIAIASLQLAHNIFRLIPGRDRIVFLSRQASKPTSDILALQNELAETLPGTPTVVLARTMQSDFDLGYAAHLVRQAWHLAHSTRIVIDSYSFLTSNLRLSPGTRVTQMWHAIGSFKRFGWDATTGANPRRRQLANLLKMHAGNTTVLASSRASVPHFASAFAVDVESVAVCPLPRVDSLRDSVLRGSTRERVLSAHPEWRDRRIVLFAPTLNSALAGPNFIDELRATVQPLGYELVTSFHPVTHGTQWGFSSSELLTVADVFLTDQSSMIYEAGLVGLPGFVWCPRDEQSAMFDESYPTAEELTSLIVSSSEDLAAALSDKARRNAAKEFADRYVDVDDSQSCTKRLVRLIAKT